MEPELPQAYVGRATLADLLDRVLDKGLFLRADLVISVAGIPLIGVTLNAVVAGIETLLEYGIMSDWDTASRTLASSPLRADGFSRRGLTESKSSSSAETELRRNEPHASACAKTPRRLKPAAQLCVST